jgi:hypothetical protein
MPAPQPLYNIGSNQIDQLDGEIGYIVSISSMEAHLVVVKAMVTKFLFFNIMPFLFERST